MEIERPRQQKAFLGGYRHRLTGVEYHHAAVQTPPKRRPDRGVVVFSRDTQVHFGASKQNRLSRVNIEGQHVMSPDAEITGHAPH